MRQAIIAPDFGATFHLLMGGMALAGDVLGSASGREAVGHWQRRWEALAWEEIHRQDVEAGMVPVSEPLRAEHEVAAELEQLERDRYELWRNVVPDLREGWQVGWVDSVDPDTGFAQIRWEPDDPPEAVRWPSRWLP